MFSPAATTFARNTARYCDGLSREFTVRFTHTAVDAVRYAAVAGTCCSDPLDCVAMTFDEATARAASMTAYFLGANAEVIPLPEGWSND